jgi:pimeloyl-ACP methyl ester carboxylesterase
MTTRRTALRHAAHGVGLAALTMAAPVPALAQLKRRTFVLIHGAWHGGWCWRDVAEVLRSQGHLVYAPTLTGLADRSHLLSTAITLDTHMADVVNLFQWQDIDDAVLVGHSYGGWPISGAVETIGPRVSSIVFLDAFVPEHGQRPMDYNSPQFQVQLREALAKGEAGRPVPDAAVFEILDPARRAWVQSKMTPQPTGVSTKAVTLTGALERIAKKTYIRAPRYPQAAFDAALARCKGDPTWRTFELPRTEAGHDAMVDAPERIAEILQQVA